MTTLTAADILQAALALPRPDRERIARELWDSVPAPGVMSEGDPGFAEELDRRAQAFRDDPSRAVDWDVAHAAVLESLHQQRAERANQD
ncbi:putative addiction module component [Botrimarina colliarenosi]|uniref:Putative addiction module component n=1 Tax=Botrimarina colliarenosi TaxID=2528001 RepID=A0A5C6AI07_9BACT|nr:putative addiction module component [Botrimarina colliarenosi]